MTDLKTPTALAMAGMLAATTVYAQAQTEHIVSEQRTSVSLRVAPEAAQAFLPQGWVSNAPATGPKLTVIFMDRKLQLTPDGKPLQSGANRVLVLSMSARNSATGEVRGMIVGGYSTDPLGVPGAYNVYKAGAVTLNRVERDTVTGGKLESRVEEHWAATGADGATVTLDLTFTRGLPTLAAFEQKIHSGVDLNYSRTYRGQQATDVLRNATVNRVQAISLKASGGPLGKAIDGTEQIVSISQAPFYTRLTFVP